MSHAIYRPYAGIGSRPKPGKPIPPPVETLARALSTTLEALGYTLRSGAAPGMDELFESGVESQMKEIFLPWPRFNNHRSELHLEALDRKDWDFLYSLAKQFHPTWDHVSPKAGLLLMRNSQQILGQFIHHRSEFVLCWTHDGRDSGGTGQALRVARHYGVPVYNLANVADLVRLYDTHEWSREHIDQFRACIPSQGR